MISRHRHSVGAAQQHPITKHLLPIHRQRKKDIYEREIGGGNAPPTRMSGTRRLTEPEEAEEEAETNTNTNTNTKSHSYSDSWESQRRSLAADTLGVSTGSKAGAQVSSIQTFLGNLPVMNAPVMWPIGSGGPYSFNTAGAVST